MQMVGLELARMGEAGGADRSLKIKIPAAFPEQFHSKLDWDFATEPEPHVDERSLYIPRGKALGGSSSINYMIYMRGQAAAAAVSASLFGLAVICARRLSQVQMTRRVAVSLTAAVTALAAVGALAVAPGTSDPFAFWVSGNTGIVIAAIYFIRGPAPGLTVLALDLAALTVGILACGSAVPIGVACPAAPRDRLQHFAFGA